MIRCADGACVEAGPSARRSPRGKLARLLLVWTVLVIAPFLPGGSPAAIAQRPLNLDFELAGVANDGRPWGWVLGWSAFGTGPGAEFVRDSLVRFDGSRSLRIAVPGSSTADAPHTIMLQLPAELARGRQLALTGWIRGQDLRGRAFLTLEAWRDRAFAAADTGSLSAGGTADGRDGWIRRDLAIRVPLDDAVHSIVIAATVEGPGTAWFDGLTLTVDGEPVAQLPTVPDPPSPADLAWLADHVAPLRDVRAPARGRADDSDLALFREIVGDARIVALGESTHGTREFFQAKHRLLEHLVREAGFTVFAIEANQLAVERVNAYVQGGPGTARDAMRVMFRVWNTEEVQELVEWMRAYNAASPDRKLRFAGFDMQDHRTPHDTLLVFLTARDSDLAGRVEDLVGEYRAQSASATPQVPDTTRVRWRRQAETLWHEVEARRSGWLDEAGSPADTMEVEWAIQSADLLRQAATFNESLSSPQRDSLMAANLDWLLRVQEPEARAVVWAHDVHVSRGGDRELSFNGGAQMGAFLSRTYGDAYRTFSLLTYDGSYSATRSFTDHAMIEAEAFPGPANSLEGALHALREGRGSGAGFVVDLRPARADPGGAWLRRPRPIRHVGYAAYDYGFELNAVLPLEFDGVVFVDRTTPSRLLPGGGP